MDLFVSVDVGTTNWKVGAFTSDGVLISLKKTATLTHYTKSGCGYYEADEVWESIRKMIFELTTELKEHNILTICCTGMAESVVGIDQYGESVGRVIAWFDTDAMIHALEIRRLIGAETIFEITGLDLNPIFSLSKLMALKQSDPKSFSKAKKWLQLPEYISYKLSGKSFTDYSLASRTMLFDIHENKWSKKLLDFIGLTENHFAKVVDSATLIGPVLRDCIPLTGLPEDCEVVVGGHDHLCGTIPAGATNGQNLLDSSGTAESFIYVSSSGAELPKVSNGLRVGRYLTKDKYVLWGGIVSSGASVEWGLSRFGESKDFNLGTFSSMGHDQFFPTYFDQSNPRICNLLFLPHLRGAGAPYWNAQVSASFVGLKNTHTAVDMMNAIFYGLTFQSKMIVDLMEKASNTKISSMNTVGGGSRLEYWQQLKANIHQRTIQVPLVSEATLLGAALLGAISKGIYSSIETASLHCYSIDHIFAPSCETNDFNEKLYRSYCQTNDALMSICEDLSSHH
jgi:xylulokinase